MMVSEIDILLKNHISYNFTFKYYVAILFQQFMKRPKNGPKWEKNLSHSISQEPYIIWFSFLVVICKGLLGCKRAKNSQKWQKILCRTPYHRNLTSYDHHLRYKSVKYIFRIFFFFSKFWFFMLLGGSKGKNGPKWQKNLLVVP